MDVRKIKKLIELLEDSQISEIEIHEGEEAVRISRTGTTKPSAGVQADPVSPPIAQAGPAGREGGPTEEQGYTVRAPMVGTFYSASSPDSSPFVQIGQHVKRGEVLCIIEAMKVMNQIEAPVTGIVLHVLVANGDPVEYGQALFEIEVAD